MNESDTSPPAETEVKRFYALYVNPPAVSFMALETQRELGLLDEPTEEGDLSE